MALFNNQLAKLLEMQHQLLGAIMAPIQHTPESGVTGY